MYISAGHSGWMSDSDTAAAGNKHSELLDCCGGLHNVDYSKVKTKTVHCEAVLRVLCATRIGVTARTSRERPETTDRTSLLRL